jgi:hypothetical protein
MRRTMALYDRKHARWMGFPLLPAYTGPGCISAACVCGLTPLLFVCHTNVNQHLARAAYGMGCLDGT